MKTPIRAGLLLIAFATTARAQQPASSDPVLAALDKKYVIPLCPLNNSDGKVTKASEQLKVATEATVAEKKSKAMDEGRRLLTEAISSGGQSGNAAAWYYLARFDLLNADLVGADSNFTKAQKLAPKCELDINGRRSRIWLALVRAGGELRKVNNEDSAMVLLRRANIIYRGSSYAYINIGEIFLDRNQPDSAATYFRLGAEVEPADTSDEHMRNMAAYDLGVTLYNLKKFDDAAAILGKYLAWSPSDNQGKKLLAQALRAAGKVDSAKVIEAQISNAATAAVAAGGDSVSIEDLFDVGVRQFNDKKYQDAADTFGKVLARAPNYRDAAYNQANCYLALNDGANLAKTAAKLVALEPLAEYDYTMLAKGHQLAKHQDSTIKWLEQREALPVSVEVASFSIKPGSAVFRAKAIGRERRDLTGKSLPPMATILVLEFLDQSGSPVATQEVSIPVLSPGATQDLSVEGQGAGIVAWRYKTK